MKDLCLAGDEERPYYWLEECGELYKKIAVSLTKLRLGSSILMGELDVLADLDASLFALWQSFEKDALAAVELIASASLPTVTLPSLFGYPGAVYCYHGIILAPSAKGQASSQANYSVVLVKRVQGPALVNRQTWGYRDRHGLYY
jgi:hypothetical protein